VPTSGNAAPIEAPAEIVAEPPPLDVGEAAAGEEGGVPGGIAGGVPGGLLPEVPPPPPAPAPPPAPRALIRIGGEVKEPALIHRVDPVYPFVATVRQLQGRVILEAIVDEEGRVESLRVLRSAGVFDEAALDAVRQWRYSPVLLNGRPEKFILTVVVSFELH
jgi:protein TonB